MIQIKHAFEMVLNKQYPCPHGALGRFAGELMVRQHRIETGWTVEVADIQPTHHVLEPGFGAGRAIELLARKATQGLVYGVDLSAVMVKRASERNAQAVRTGRVMLQQGDIARLPFAEGQFDRIISIHTFYFWSDPPALYAEVLRVLKPGGKFIFTLAIGRIGETQETGLAQIIEEQTLPLMREIGFTTVSTMQGPLSRRFKILAVMGTKPVLSP